MKLLAQSNLIVKKTWLSLYILSVPVKFLLDQYISNSGELGSIDVDLSTGSTV